MAYEITNALRSTSIIRVTGAGFANVQLANLATSANETVTAAKIKRVMWSTGGTVSIERGGETVLTLYGSGDLRPSDSGHIIANNSTSNMNVSIATGGTAIIEVTKEATYSTELIGI
jgi:hypothetical protein